MNDDNKSIHEFDFELICEYYASLDRQGPGSEESTRKALSFIPLLGEHSKVADIGCGTGGQTMTLAKLLPGQITGLDLFPVFIDLFNQNAANLQLQHRVKGITGTMENLPFEPESLDLIWSEGAIYNIGFERVINDWRPFLKQGGYMAVTEATWFTYRRPQEIHDFWTREYPEIDTIPAKISQLQKAGYVLEACFALPEECWTTNFYQPQIKTQADFLRKHTGNATAVELVANQQHEAGLYEKYKAFYGYVFYVARKV